MKVVINCDDFGSCYGANEAIVKACLSGIATSASIMTNQLAFQNACLLAKTSLKKKGLGLHLNLTHGRANQKYLADSFGNYKFSFLDYWLKLKNGNRKLLTEITHDLEKQFLIAQKEKLIIDHVDGEQHIHMLPPIFNVVCELCQKYNVHAIRISKESYWSMPFSINLGTVKNAILSRFAEVNAKIASQYKLKTTDACFGTLATSQMSARNIKTILSYTLKKGYQTIEIFSHPAIVNHPKDQKYLTGLFSHYSNKKAREVEAKALLDYKLMQFIKDSSIELISFRSLQ